MLDLECVIVDRFHWSLKEIDDTDIESLIPFVFRFPRWKDGQSTNDQAEQVYVDEADWF